MNDACLNAIITEQDARLDAAEKSLRLLADDWRKQRAVNEMMLKWLNVPSSRLNVAHEQLADVLREAIKQ